MKLFSRKSKKEIPLDPSEDEILSSPSLEEEFHDLEQKLSPPPTLEVRGELSSRENFNYLMEYQMTVSPKVEISGKDASILLMICNSMAATHGVDFTLYLTMEWLYMFLLKGYLTPIEYPIEKGKQSLMLAELILVASRGTWLSLGEYEELPEEVRKEIFLSGWLPTAATLRSWMQYRSPKNFFQVRAVRLDSFLENERNSERYSSYTKGYGEGGKLSRVQKTPFSSELDGSSSEKVSFRFSLIDILTYNSILNQIEKWKSKKAEE